MTNVMRPLARWAALALALLLGAAEIDETGTPSVSV